MGFTVRVMYSGSVRLWILVNVCVIWELFRGFGLKFGVCICLGFVIMFAVYLCWVACCWNWCDGVTVVLPV